MILLRYDDLNDMLQERLLPLAVPIAVGVGLAVTLASVIAMVPVRQPVPDNVTVAVKADRPAVIPGARVVHTIPISVRPDPVPQPALATPAPAEAPPAKVAQYIMPVAPPAHTDVCKRHGGYKGVRGRSWHCVYNRH